MRRLVLIALAVAAGPAPAEEPLASVEHLLPLAVGNRWTYRVAAQEDRFVVRAARQEMVGAQTCFLLEARLRDRVVATEHVAFTKDGLYRFKADQTEIHPPICVLRVPPPKQRWSQRYTLNGREGHAWFGARPDDVSVLSKKYKATLVQGWTTPDGRGPPRTRVWYAPGVGPVKQEIEEGKNRWLVLELEEFEKAGGK